MGQLVISGIVMSHNIAINHRAFGTGLKTATRFIAGYGRRYARIYASNIEEEFMLRTFVLLTFLYSACALSCGSTAQHFFGYSKWSSKSDKEAFFEANSCGVPINYGPKQADPLIADAVVDGINSGVNKDLLFTILRNYNCAYGARHQSNYKVIKEFITREKYATFCNLERLQRIFIIQADGGLTLRDSASKQGKRIDALANGTYVEVLRESGDWAYVKSYHGEGYVYKKLLTPY